MLETLNRLGFLLVLSTDEREVYERNAKDGSMVMVYRDLVEKTVQVIRRSEEDEDKPPVVVTFNRVDPVVYKVVEGLIG